MTIETLWQVKETRPEKDHILYDSTYMNCPE